MDFIKGKESLIMLVVLAAGGLLTVVGGLIGNTVFGWILFVLGLLLIAANLYFYFSNYRELYENKRQWSLIGAGILVVLLIIALVAMLVSAGNARANNTILAETAVPEATETDVPEVAKTTAIPTEMATVTTSEPVISVQTEPIFVCLNEKAPYGLNIRVEPQVDSAYGGIIQWGSCFTVDGKAAGFPGWYHVTPGQEGIAIGVSIGVDENKALLWVNGEYLESFGVNLEILPALEVPEK